MFGDDGGFLLIAKAVDIFSSPQLKSLVHADMDFLGGETFIDVLEHLLDEGIDLLISDKKDVIDVEEIVEPIPCLQPSQVGESLNAGAKLHAFVFAIRVELLDLFVAITPPHVTEIRLFLYLIGIFRVKHQIGVAKRRKEINKPLQGG